MVRRLTAEEARELYRIRESLEGLGARLFAEQVEPEGLSRLEHAYRRVTEAYDLGDPKKVLEAKNAFYDAIHVYNK